MNNNTFMVGASFLNEDGCAEIKTIPFDSELRIQIAEMLTKQYEDFRKLESIPYDGRYKVDNDERLTISSYTDPDQTFSEFQKCCSGQGCEELVDIEGLIRCKAILIALPGLSNHVLVQRFYKTMIASRDRFFGCLDGKVFTRIAKSVFSFGSTVAGVYDCSAKALSFRSIATIRGALPKFDEIYAPGADDNMMNQFFGNGLFEQESAKAVLDRDSKKISRLVWLINDSKVDVAAGVDKFKTIDRLLNMGCFQEGKLCFPHDVKRIQIVLRTILGDVFEEDGKVFLTNSKRPIDPFPSPAQAEASAQ